MLLTNEETQGIVQSNYCLDFGEIVLTQQKESDPIIYRGPGKISLNSDGSISLAMSHTYSSSTEVSRDIGDMFHDKGIPAGTIVERHHFFSLRATDAHGRHWEADDLSIHGSISFVSSSRSIESRLKRIEAHWDREQDGSAFAEQVFFIIPGHYHVPCNEIERTDKSTSRTITKLSVLGTECQIKKRDTHLEITSGIPQEIDALNFSYLLLEAISVAIGNYLWPRVKTISTKSTNTLTIQSASPNNGNDLPSPIPLRYPQNALNLNQFIDGYLHCFQEPYSQFFGYWYRVFSSSSGELENRALVLTTSIEGTLKEYFPTYGVPDDDFLSQITSAALVIKPLEIGKRAKDRILSTLGNAKNPTAKGALHDLANRKLIPNDLVKAWVSLRNKSAHADELKQDDIELQKFLDEIHSCLELFYRLFLIQMRFEGEFIEYSKADWPAATMTTQVQNNSSA